MAHTCYLGGEPKRKGGRVMARVVLATVLTMFEAAWVAVPCAVQDATAAKPEG